MLGIALVLPTALRAQVRTAAYVPFSALRAADYVAVTYIPPYPEDPGDTEGARSPHGPGKSAGPQAATFELRFSSNFPAAARDAFRYAADIWGRYLTSPEPIVVEAEWRALDEGTLGSAGPLLVGNFAGAEYNNVWYPAALASLLRGSDVSAAQPDIFAGFNSEFEAWYFGLDGQVPSNRYDFVTVVLHELAHGLGFSGSFNVDDGDPSNGDECPDAGAAWGCWGIPAEQGGDVFPLVFDLFTQDDREVSLLVESAYPNPSTNLARILTSGTVFFDGDFSRPLNENVPVDLYAPTTFDVGSSYSHLDESAFPTPPGGTADPDALMTPFLARGEAIHNPGLVTCAMFEDFGWELGAGCDALLALTSQPREGSPPDAHTVTWFYPNPASSEVTASVGAATPQTVIIEVYDAAGRRVISDAHGLSAGGAEEIRLKTDSWPAGVYFIRLIGESFQRSGSLVVARP